MGIKLILNLFLLVSLVNCDPKVGEIYAMIDNRRLNKSQGLPALSILHCSAMCHNLGQNCCLLNFDSEILMCYWSPNCSEIRSEMGGISFKRKEKSDCSDVPDGSNSGVYKIDPIINGGKEIEVFCDMETDAGGWTLLQRRVNAATSFDRPWTDYKSGFGNLRDNFWLGNDNIHAIVSKKAYKVRFDLQDKNDETSYAEYSTFSIDDEANRYTLTINGYSGTAGNAILEGSDPYLHNLNGMAFSTRDKDSDRHGRYNCAYRFNRCGWWFNCCTKANINGIYNSTNNSPTATDKIYWFNWREHEGLKRVEMKVKPFMID